MEDQTVAALTKLTLDANERHLVALEERIARLSAQLAEADGLIAAVESIPPDKPESHLFEGRERDEPEVGEGEDDTVQVQERDKAVFMPGSTVYRSPLSQADITAARSPFFPDVEQRKRYALYSSPSNWSEKDRRSLLEAVTIENKRIHAFACQARGEDPLRSVRELPDSAFEYNTIGIDWERIASLFPDRSARECKVQWLGSDHPSINSSDWSNDEIERLGQLVESVTQDDPSARVDWVDIATRLATRRVPLDCMRQWVLYRAPRKLHLWTPEEDAALLDAVSRLGTNNWSLVAVSISPHLDSKQCHERYTKSLNPIIKHGRWTDEQDEQLKTAVDLHGKNWDKVSPLVPGRTNAQCRERWVNVLDPELRKGPWTDEEDAQILEAVNQHGEKWTVVAALLKGRTDNMCRRRWLRLESIKNKKASKPQLLSSSSQQSGITKKKTKYFRRGEVADSELLTTTPLSATLPTSSETAGTDPRPQVETTLGAPRSQTGAANGATTTSSDPTNGILIMDIDSEAPPAKKKPRPKPRMRNKEAIATSSSTTSTGGAQAVTIADSPVVGGRVTRSKQKIVNALAQGSNQGSASESANT